MFKKEKRYLYLSAEETSILLQSLVRLKNALIREGRCNVYFYGNK